MRKNLDHLPTPSTLDFLLTRFQTLTIGVAELAVIFREREQSIRNAISEGRYPIPSFHVSPRRRRFLLTDVAQYIDGQRRSAADTENSHSNSRKLVAIEKDGNRLSGHLDISEQNTNGGQKRSRGRPTKAEQVARMLAASLKASSSS